MPSDWYSALQDRLAVEAELSEGSAHADLDIWKTIEQRVQIAEYRPQASPDVIKREIKDRQGVYYVLKNKTKKTYLRLSSDEYNLWSEMDGQTSVEDLIVENFMATGQFAHARIVRLVNQLLRHHMLIEVPITVWADLKKGVIQRSWLHRLSAPARYILTQRFSIRGLDHIIEKIYQYGGWLCFTRAAKVIFLLVSVLGLMAYFVILRDQNYVFIGENFVVGLVVLWMVAILPVIIHELGHALTVKHYGREVPRGGVMLYLGMPAAFVETTDIWLEPRRARLMVTWNGPYTGLILGGLAALFIYIFPGAAINQLLFKMAGFAYLTVFFNVNPLLKFDGYYLLSDALDIPSLRERSLAFLRRGVREKILQKKRFTREDKIFTVFGILSLAWTAYAFYLILFMWQTRLRASVQALFGSGYSIITRLLSILLIAGVISLLFMVILSLYQLARSLISRYIKAGALQQHGRMALIGAGLALGIGISLPFIFPNYVLQISASLGLCLSLGVAVRLLIFNKTYWGSLRGLAYLSFAVALILNSIAQVPRLFPGYTFVGHWLEWGVILALLVGGMFLIWPPTARLKYGALILGVLVGAGCWVFLKFLTGVSFVDPDLIIMTALVTVSVWVLFALRGSARVPAMALMFLGGIFIGLSWLFMPPFGDLKLVGSLTLIAGALHLVYARLPELSAYETESIHSQTQKAIADSVAIIVRRIIAQVFFESGWPGVAFLGRDFSAAMRRNGIALSIQVNKFYDQELPKRSAAELTEVYGLAFDELHILLCRELGREMGSLTFGYGIDLLPWQNREVVVEVILSRRTWGLTLSQEMRDLQTEHRKFLKRVPLFVPCSDEELDRVAAVLKRERFAVGEVILHQGDPGDKFYIVEHGKATVWQTGDDGIEREVDEKGPGQYFGEVALVSDAPRNATVRSETPLVLLSLEQAEFDLLVRQYVDLAEQVDRGVKYGWLLRGMPIFDELDSQELDQLVERLQLESFEAGEVLFEEGDVGDKFYIVESGQLVVTRSVNGKVVELSRRGAGEYVGEIALLQNRPRTATITCAVDSTLLSLEAEHFHELVSGHVQVSEVVKRTGSRRLTFVQRAGRRFSPSIQHVEA